jgi:oxaloacetate decarboxylase alpha subunit
VNAELQAKVLEGKEPVTCRPADLLEPEMETLTTELRKIAAEEGFSIESGDQEADDVLTYALFNEIGLKFLRNRGNPDAFEPAPTGEEVSPPATAVKTEAAEGVYTVTVAGESYVVQVTEGGDVSALTPVQSAPTQAATQTAPAPAPSGGGEALPAPLAGNIFKILVSAGDSVNEGDVLIILEAMKMETEIKAPRAGTIAGLNVKSGDSVAVGDTLLTLS